jgi:hypothetical protein
MEQADSFECMNEARFSATPKLRATAFEAAPLIKPPALWGVSDLPIGREPPKRCYHVRTRTNTDDGEYPKAR